MTAKWRIRIGTAITAALIIALAAYGAWRVREWNARGWAGLTFVPDIAKWQHFRYPRGVATDRSGNVYVADYGTSTITRVTQAGATTVVGLRNARGGVDGIETSARFDAPHGVATDNFGNVYVADSSNKTIRKITPSGVVTTLAGLAGSDGHADGMGSAARFKDPKGVATDGSGNIYVADSLNNTIRKVTPAGVVTTLAGLAGRSGHTDGTGSAARFDAPEGVATDIEGNVYVADTNNATIRKITPAGVVTTLAGLAQDKGGSDGVGTAARFNRPTGVATGQSGNVYVADSENHVIRKITPTGVVTTLAPHRRFNKPVGVATDSDNNIYVADLRNAIWKITPSGVVTAPAVFADVIAVYPDSPAYRAGIRLRDHVVAINSIRTCEPDRLAALRRRVKNGSTLIYQIKRGGQERSARVTLTSPLRSTQFILTFVVNLLVGLSFLGIGLLVFWRRPDDRRALVFFAMGLVLFVVSLADAFELLSSMFRIDANMLGLGEPGYSPSSLESAAKTAPMATAAAVFLSCAFLSLTLHLALIFPKERPILTRRPHVIRKIYGLSLATVVSVSLIFLIFPLVQAAPPLSCAVLPLFPIALIGAVYCGLLYPIWTCVALYRSYRESRGEEKRQVTWPLWGTIVAISGVLIAGHLRSVIADPDLIAVYPSLSPDLLMRANAALGVIIPMLFLLIPISFAFAILKYRLMDIDVVIKKTVLYTMLSGIIVVIYLLLVGGLGTALVKFAGVQSQTLVIASTLLVAVAFVPLRNGLQHVVDRRLFRQRYDYPQALRGIGTAMVRASELPEFLSAAAEQIQQALPNRATVVFIRKLSDFVASAKVGPPDEILGSMRVPANGGLVALLSEPFDPRKSAVPEPEQAALRKISPALVVPIRTQSELQGFVTLGSRLSDQEYGAEDTGFATSAADQIAVGIDHFRLKKEEVEFAQAREMQQMLLPHEIPQIEGFRVSGIWQPARIVGGDYFDVIPVGEDKLAVCIGDVAGKGMPAALLMSSLQAAVRASVGPEVPADELCSRVARVVVPNLSAGRFITFFFCLLNGRDRSIAFCNAGHNPPILVRADGQVERLSVGGPVLNRLFRGHSYGKGELSLARGDRIILFTDGVTEARNKAEEEFGEQRLEELVVSHRELDPCALQQTILESVAPFCLGNFEDDVTLVIIGAAA